MKSYFVLSVFFVVFTMGSQNLVPNPGFDSIVYCPTAFGQVSACASWYQSTNNLLPPHGTDYMSSCHTSTLSTPANYWGYAVPSTASGYMAMSMMAPSLANNYRENIFASLNSSLIPGHVYQFAAKISRSDYCKFATNNFGVKLSSIANFPINNVSAFSNTAIVTDTSVWTTVSGLFTADSAYTYICIGNFYDDANTIVATACSSCPYPYYEYFIDDVSLVDMTEVEGISEKTEKDLYKVYPNPNSGTFTIELKASSTIVITDILGNEVSRTFFAPGVHIISLDATAKGIYFLKLKGQTQIVKLCIY